ncbi:MAG: AI-2E family transporter [Rhodothermia bacterium]|nr:AI-2E family transporter [Rhodothermia bacterium]
MASDGKSRSESRSSDGLSALDATLIGGSMALFLVLLYTMREFLNPILVGGAGFILLWPIRSHRAVRAILISGAFLLILWFFDRISTVLLPFGVAYLLAFLFSPVVRFLNQRFRVPRWTSSLIVTGIIIGVFATIFLILVPNLVGQLEVLGGRMLGGISGFRGWLSDLTILDNLEGSGLIEKDTFISLVIAAVQDQATALASGIPDAAQQVVRSIGSILGLITVVAIMPVLIFYNVKDFEGISERLRDLFPTFGGRREYLIQAGSVVGNYLRGQLTISAIAAFNVSVLLVIFDVPFALLIGLLGGLLNMIPNVGAIITNLIGITLAIVFGDPWLVKAAIVFAVLLGQSLLEQSVLTPQILGRQVGLHPILIILSLFVFGTFFGLLGLFIAVPVTALIVTAYKAWQEELNFEIADFVAT